MVLFIFNLCRGGYEAKFETINQSRIHNYIKIKCFADYGAANFKLTYIS